MRTTPSLPLPRLPKIGLALPQYETQVSGVAGVDTSAVALTQSGYAASRKRLQLAAWNPDAGVGGISGAEARACAADIRRHTRSSAGPASAPLRGPSGRSSIHHPGHRERVSGGGAIRRRVGGGGGGRGAPSELPGGPRAVLSQRTPPRSEVRARNFRFAVFGAFFRAFGTSRKEFRPKFLGNFRRDAGGRGRGRLPRGARARRAGGAPSPQPRSALPARAASPAAELPARGRRADRALGLHLSRLDDGHVQVKRQRRRLGIVRGVWTRHALEDGDVSSALAGPVGSVVHVMISVRP